MATAAQLAANRANSQFFTGPTSSEGKLRSSQNSLRHGFRSQSVLLPGDDPAEYEALLDELTQRFRPEGLPEERFVREMADAEWRLRRVRAHQEDLLTAKIEDLANLHTGASPIRLQALAYDALHRETSFAQFLRYETKFECQYDRAYNGWMTTREKLSRHNAREVGTRLESILVPPRKINDLPNEPNSALPQTPDLPNKPNSASPKTPVVPNEANSTPPETPVLPNEPQGRDWHKRPSVDVCVPVPQPPALPNEPNSIPRNAPCPCGSGQKFKRCCGKNAPAVLFHGARAA